MYHQATATSDTDRLYASTRTDAVVYRVHCKVVTQPLWVPAHLFLLIVGFTLTPQHHIHVLKHLLDIASETMYGWIPVASCIALEGIKHHRQDDMTMLCH